MRAAVLPYAYRSQEDLFLWWLTRSIACFFKSCGFCAGNSREASLKTSSTLSCWRPCCRLSIPWAPLCTTIIYIYSCPYRLLQHSSRKVTKTTTRISTHKHHDSPDRSPMERHVQNLAANDQSIRYRCVVILCNYTSRYTYIVSVISSVSYLNKDRG